jgi:hypothetical protein
MLSTSLLERRSACDGGAQLMVTAADAAREWGDEPNPDDIVKHLQMPPNGMHVCLFRCLLLLLFWLSIVYVVANGIHVDIFQCGVSIKYAHCTWYDNVGIHLWASNG